MHRHVWKVIHTEPSIMEKALSNPNFLPDIKGYGLSSQTVTFECEKCKSQKVQKV